MKLLLTIFAVLFSCALFAQQLPLNAKVIDAQTGEEVGDANVTVYLDVLETVKTNSAGEFYVEVQEHQRNAYDEFRIGIYKPGYERIDETFRAPLTTIKLQPIIQEGFDVLVKDRKTNQPIPNALVQIGNGRKYPTNDFGITFVEVDPGVNPYQDFLLSAGKPYYYRTLSEELSLKDVQPNHVMYLDREVITYEQLDFEFDRKINLLHRNNNGEGNSNIYIAELITLYDAIMRLSISDPDDAKKRDDFYPYLKKWIDGLTAAIDPFEKRQRNKLKMAHDALVLNYKAELAKLGNNRRPTLDGNISAVELLLNYSTKIIGLKINLQETGLDYSAEIATDATTILEILDGAKSMKEFYADHLSDSQVKRLDTLAERYVTKLDELLNSLNK